ncbi:hypothetical protein [Solimonas soli]|uniref:hypothetical protein n=1 Tax=Solimonas soli TaxID=413479 RepID=UPI0012FC69EB|nr:hypothetical protein [Solimonas soli]
MDAKTPSLDRLVPPSEGMKIVGVRSPTSYYNLIKLGELPPLIKRGRNSFHLESDLLAYVRRLASTRIAA